MSKPEGEKSSEWGAYSKNYQQVMATVPSVFSEMAISILFPSLDTGSVGFVKLVDIAAGPGVFLSALFRHMSKINVEFQAGSSLLATDFASGMVESAQRNIMAMDLSRIGAPSLDFRVVDACDPHNLEDGSFTHLVCMFGVMFFPHRAQALRCLREKLITGSGRAIFGSWCSTAASTLCDEFGVYIDPAAASKRPPAESSPLSVCADPKVFKQELVDAGFSHVEVVQRDHVFELPNDDDLFDALFSNPAILGMFPEFSPQAIAVGVLRQKWREFLLTEAGSKWVRIVADQEVLVLHYQANLAIAIA